MALEWTRRMTQAQRTVERGSTDGIGVDTAVTGETEAGAAVEGTDETGAVDEVEAVDDTEGSTDMETGALEDDAGTGTLELEEPQACVQFRATKKDRPEADDRTHDRKNR